MLRSGLLLPVWDVARCQCRLVNVAILTRRSRRVSLPPEPPGERRRTEWVKVVKRRGNPHGVSLLWTAAPSTIPPWRRAAVLSQTVSRRLGLLAVLVLRPVHRAPGTTEHPRSLLAPALLTLRCSHDHPMPSASSLHLSGDDHGFVRRRRVRADPAGRLWARERRSVGSLPLRSVGLGLGCPRRVRPPRLARRFCAHGDTRGVRTRRWLVRRVGWQPALFFHDSADVGLAMLAVVHVPGGRAGHGAPEEPGGRVLAPARLPARGHVPWLRRALRHAQMPIVAVLLALGALLAPGHGLLYHLLLALRRRWHGRLLGDQPGLAC